MEYLVVVDVDGTIYGMWSDDLIGLYEVQTSRVEVTRASHVEWFLDAWHVWEADGVTPMCPRGFRTREAALTWEREEIERRLMLGRVK